MAIALPLGPSQPPPPPPPPLLRRRRLRQRRHSPFPPARLLLIIAAALAAAMSLLLLLLSVAPCLVGATCYRGYFSAFSFDAGQALHPAWMASIPDRVNITSLSIPGTHDTMTYDIASQTLQCQNWNLSAQLRAGLRYIDIRARLRDDELHIYHADGYTGYGYRDVLLDLFGFLDEFPSEAVIMRLKEEGAPLGRNSISFEDAVNYHHRSSPETAPGAAAHLHAYDFAAPMPTLGALRSKVFILQNFPSDPARPPYGLAWEGPEMVLEDMWIVPDVYHLADKWAAIRDALELAALAPDDNRFLYLAHLSASVGVLPIEAAAGPMNRSIQGMNDMTGQYLEDAGSVDNDGMARVGVVIIDFPGQRLIDSVLNWNLRLMK